MRRQAESSAIAADAAVVWTFRKLIEWYREAVSTYVRKKSETTDYTEIAAALESMTNQRGIPLDTETVAVEEEPLFENPDERGNSRRIRCRPDAASVDKATVLAERLDQALKQATQPLEQSCERVRVLISKTEVLLEIGPAERGIIASPLTAPPPKRDWRSAKIKFERINRKTGKALFYFEGENDTHAAHYCHIIDPNVPEAAQSLYAKRSTTMNCLKSGFGKTHPGEGSVKPSMGSDRQKIRRGHAIRYALQE